MIALLFAALLQDESLTRIRAELDKLNIEVEAAGKIEDPELRRETLRKLNDRIKAANESLQALDQGAQEKKPEMPPVRFLETGFRLGTAGSYQYLTSPVSTGTFASFGAAVWGVYTVVEEPIQLDLRLSISSLVNYERGANNTTALAFCPAVIWRFLDESFTTAVAHPYVGVGLGVDVLWQSNVSIAGATVRRTADPSVGADLIAGLALDASDAVQFFAEFQYKVRAESTITADSGAARAVGRENFSGIFFMLGASYRL